MKGLSFDFQQDIEEAVMLLLIMSFSVIWEIGNFASWQCNKSLVCESLTLVIVHCVFSELLQHKVSL
jgi:hypothetical protein